MKPPLFFQWLLTPYKLDISFKGVFYSALFFGVFVFLFLYIFQPFEIHVLEDELKLEIFFGVITFLAVFVMLILFPKVLKLLSISTKWNYGKIILISLLTEFIIAVANYWVFKAFQENLLGIDFFNHLFYAFFVGFIAVIIYLVIYQNITELIEKKSNTNKLEEPKSNLNNTITIVEDNNKNKVVFLAENLVYASSQGNYTSLFLVDVNDEVKEKLIRISLSKIEKKLKEYSNFIRCHRSFIVNTCWFDGVSGNAKSSLLTSKRVSKKIPVSRSFPKEKLNSLISLQ